MKHWKETVIKQEQIKWKRPPIKNIKDGKLDIILTIPLTGLFEAQAKHSYLEGMQSVMELLIQSQKEKTSIEQADIIKMLNTCGFPELVNIVTKG
jgi:hypothetical protein